MNARDRELFAELMWRSTNDQWRRSQFTKLPAGNGYLCESGAHEEREATHCRPPMLEVKAGEVLFCADCWRKLPE